MRRVPIQSSTVDSEGKVVETRTTYARLFPPPPTACPVCARDPAHPPDQPHNALSIYYQMAFKAEHGRWPTWKDAIAHCDPETQERWTAILKDMGKWTEPSEPPVPE